MTVHFPHAHSELPMLQLQNHCFYIINHDVNILNDYFLPVSLGIGIDGKNGGGRDGTRNRPVEQQLQKTPILGPPLRMMSLGMFPMGSYV